MSVTLVTGATGQDGSYLLERLREEDAEVHVLVRPGESLEGVEQHVGELDALPRLVAEVRPDEIVHLAGLSSVALSWAEPVLTAEVNALSAARLLEACWALQESGHPVRVVHAASAEVFAGTSEVPQRETTPLAPRSPYGAAKAYALHLGQVYRARGLHVAGAVLYNHESPRRPTTFVTRRITSTVAAIARGEAEVLTLGNLEARRDWGWAPDYVDAVLRMLRAPVADDFVVATGVSHSVREFAAAAFRRAGVQDWEPRLQVDPAFTRPTDAAELVGDATRAREVLGWKPTVGFEELVGRMVDADLA